MSVRTFYQAESSQNHQLEPLSVFLVRKGGTGDRILFRYPYNAPIKKAEDKPDPNRNPYALKALPESLAFFTDSEAERLSATNLITFPSKVLSSLFAVDPRVYAPDLEPGAQPNQGAEKFELKIDDVRFVGHPVGLELAPGEEANFFRYSGAAGRKKPESTLSMFHVVFALSAGARYSVVQEYHLLSKLIGRAIRYEERRSGFLTEQSQLLSNIQDEVNSQPEEERRTSPFAEALERSELAKELKRVFEDVGNTGIVQSRFNGWPEVSFCLPQKVHKKINPNLMVEPDTLKESSKMVKPYHGILLMSEEKELLDQLPLDSNPAFRKVITQAKPTKSMSVIALDTDLTKKMVCRIACHLFYWGKACLVYPVCSTNLYVVSGYVPDPLSRHLRDRFTDKFPGESLEHYLQVFSFPTSIDLAVHPTAPPEQTELMVRVIVWCLQHHILVQLHCYPTLVIETRDGKRTSFKDPLYTKKQLAKASLPKTFLVPEEERVNGNTTEDWHKEDLEASARRIVTITEAEFNNGTRLDSQKSPDELIDQMFKYDSERAAIREAAAASRSSAEDVLLFLRMVPYMNGRRHLEDIMFYENVTRARLLQTIDRFRDVLTMHEHEDNAVTSYFKKAMI